MKGALYIGGGAVVLVALAGGAFLFFQVQALPGASSATIDAAFADASSSPSISTPSTAIEPPPNSTQYKSDAYGFSLYYPNSLAVSERQVGGGSSVILFEDQTSHSGFQIFVTPYSEQKITPQRFAEDEPSGVMQNPQNITIDGAAATEFMSTNPAMGSAREIWFLHGGYLYEVTAPQALDQWLFGVMETWSFN